jgi:hypothetical protein
MSMGGWLVAIFGSPHSDSFHYFVHPSIRSFLVFCNGTSLHSSGWTGTLNSPTSASRVLGLQVGTSIPRPTADIDTIFADNPHSKSCHIPSQSNVGLAGESWPQGQCWNLIQSIIHPMRAALWISEMRLHVHICAHALGPRGRKGLHVCISYHIGRKSKPSCDERTIKRLRT